jgi:peroxiredoxin
MPATWRDAQMAVRWLCLHFLWGLMLLPTAGQADEAASLPLSRKIAALSLPDFRGRIWSLEDFQDQRLLVVAFLGTECPLATLYAPRLADLATEYGPRGVGFVAVNSNMQDSLAEIAAYARRHELAFPILKDLGNKVADQFSAVRTPEVFLLDEERIVRYRGRIDDQYGVGVIRKAPERRDLAEAIDELLAGQPVSVPETQARGCFIGRVRQPRADAAVTYANQVSRLLNQRCVECHRPGEIAPFSLTSHEEAVGWAETIAEVVADGRMPPWHADPAHGEFADDRRLSEAERAIIVQWVADGAPEGDPADLPEPPDFPAPGWALPREPDAVFAIQSEPFRVPAEGAVAYQYFVVDSGLTEDKWISAAELLPGNRRVVHHILAFARQPGSRDDSDEGGARGFLVAYVPGLRPAPYPTGMAKRIPAGSELVFQVHYTPIGSEQLDISHLGLVFADSESVLEEVRTTSATDRNLHIPPGADDHVEEAFSPTSPLPVKLLSLMPHMHLRGKAFRYELVHPDGGTEILLDVPRYDFNWQTCYRLAEPLTLPPGTRMHCTARYDNSAGNLNNPDPSATVRWGSQTWEEMMIGYFDIALPRAAAEAARAGNASATDADRALRRAAAIVARLDQNNDGSITLEEVPENLRGLFKRLDTDESGDLTIEEIAAGQGGR